MTATVYYQIQREGFVSDTWFDLDGDYARNTDFNVLEQRIKESQHTARYRIVKVTKEVLDKVY